MRSRAERALSRAVVVNAGDTVLLCFNSPISYEEFDQVVGMMSVAMPGVRFACVDDIARVVVKKEDSHSE